MLLFTSLFPRALPPAPEVGPITFNEAPFRNTLGGGVIYAKIASTPRAVVQEDLPAFGDGEILALVWLTETGDKGGVAFRVSSTDGYLVQFDAGTVELYRRTSGSGTVIASGSCETATQGVPRWVRIQADDETIRARVWPWDREEPAAWQIDTTDGAPVLAAGGIGVAATTSGTRDSGVELGYLSVGYGATAAPAPGDPVSTGQHRVDISNSWSMTGWAWRWGSIGSSDVVGWTTFGAFGLTSFLWTHRSEPRTVARAIVNGDAADAFGGQRRFQMRRTITQGSSALMLHAVRDAGLLTEFDLLGDLNHNRTRFDYPAMLTFCTSRAVGDDSPSYIAAHIYDETDSLRIIRRSAAGAETTLAQHALGYDVTNLWHRIRVNVKDGVIRARAWRSEDPEPTGWQIEVSNQSALILPGYVGFGGLGISQTGIGRLRLFSVSQDPDTPAPAEHNIAPYDPAPAVFLRTGGFVQLGASRHLELNGADEKCFVGRDTSTSFAHYVPTVDPIPYASEKVYWEVHGWDNRATNANWNGYCAVVSQAFITANSSGLVNPVLAGAVGYRGDGTIWSSNASQLATGLAYPARSDGRFVAMMCFNPVTGALWVGRDGAWHANPATDPPSFTISSSETAWFPAVQVREQNQRCALVSEASQFRYAPPTGAVGLAELMRNAEPIVFDPDEPWEGPGSPTWAMTASSPGG